jgi:hypothetical protein
MTLPFSPLSLWHFINSPPYTNLSRYGVLLPGLLFFGSFWRGKSSSGDIWVLLPAWWFLRPLTLSGKSLEETCWVSLHMPHLKLEDLFNALLKYASVVEPL